jgi:hypothetical protein
MQKDEEVGKVAQATPVVICTSLYTDLFLMSREYVSLLISISGIIRCDSKSIGVIPGYDCGRGDQSHS